VNVLIATLGSFGDVYPFVGLGVTLKRRGHSVTLLTNPFFEELAGKYDLGFVAIGTRQQYEQFANHPALFDPRKSLSVFFDTLVVPSIRPAYARLCEELRDETVIVSGVTAFAARLVQEGLGVPVVTAHNIPMAIKSAHEMPRNGMFTFPDRLPLALKRLYWWVADRAVVDPLICPELNAFRRELGLAPVSRILTRWCHSPQMVIGLFPSWFASPQPDWPPETRLTGFPLFDEGQEAAITPDVRSFLADGEPPVIFLPASLMQQGREFFEVAVRSCRAAGKRAILLSRYKHHIPSTLPEGVRHFEYIPLAHILPEVEALVHQGGIGTCAQALRHGVPQLIRPLAYDQFDNAWRLKQLGVGDWITADSWSVPAVTAKLQAVAGSIAVRERCQEVAGRFEGIDPLLDTCKLIESVL